MLLSKGVSAWHAQSQYYGTGFCKKKKALLQGWLARRQTGGKAQLHLPDLGLGTRWKGFWHHIFLDSRLSLLKVFQCPGSGHVPVLWFHGRVQLRVHKCYSWVVYLRFKHWLQVLLKQDRTSLSGFCSYAYNVILKIKWGNVDKTCNKCMVSGG